jgi:hypothetical protein
MTGQRCNQQAREGIEQIRTAGTAAVDPTIRTAKEAVGRAEDVFNRAADEALETKVAAFGAQRGSGPQVDKGRAGRDPGDAVPPGVGVAEPDEPSEAERRVFEHMNEKLGPE